MRDDEIDRVLAEEDDMGPRPGFHDRVMDAIHREATTPPPIPFPWERAWPAIAAAALVFVGVPVWVAPVAGSLVPAAERFGAPWIALAALSTLCSVLLSRRLAEERY